MWYFYQNIGLIQLPLWSTSQLFPPKPSLQKHLIPASGEEKQLPPFKHVCSLHGLFFAIIILNFIFILIIDYFFFLKFLPSQFFPVYPVGQRHI